VQCAIVARELNIRLIETVCITSYANQVQGRLDVIKRISDDFLMGNGGKSKDVLCIDDLVDTGATAKKVREMLPRAHYATVYAKPEGRALVDTFVTEVSQDTWVFFLWDMGL